MIRWMMLVTLLLSPLIGGCGGKQAPPPPPTVTIAKPITRIVRTTAEFTGITRAIESAEIRARVPGVLTAMHFDPTSFVRRGDLLFTIEQKPYQSARDAAYARLKSTEAELALAESDLSRIEVAIENNAVSEQDLDQAKAKRDQADARVLAARAELDQAELNLGYARVRSPISGQVSRNFVDVGNLVGKDGPTLLTTVNKLDPIYVYFDAPERLVLRFLERVVETVEDVEEEKSKIRAQVKLANEDSFRHEGFIDYIDNTVDVSTGTIQLRALLENDDLLLFPGLFVRIRIIGGQPRSSILVEERALANDIGGKYVLTVGDNDIVEQHYVKLGQLQDDGMIVIEEGLDADANYIVNGILRARPGQPVTPMTEAEVRAKVESATGDGR